MPITSVIIPTYNRAFTVGKAIESVLQQTFTDYEIIVVDDGSTDNTRGILKPYWDKIHYEYKENGGISSARNRGLEIARGEYIALLDSDDFWKPEKLQKQMECFAKHPEYGMVATRCVTNTVDNNFKTIDLRQIRRNGKSGWIYEALFHKNFIRTSSVVIKKECFDKVGWFDENLPRCNDIDMWLRISKKYPVGFIKEVLTVYTRRPEEIRHSKVEGRKKWVQVLKKNYDPEYIPKALYRKRMTYIYNHIAKNSLQIGNKNEAKIAIQSALSLSPFNLKAWKNYFFFILKN